MATKKYYLGSHGPFLIDDTALIADPDGDFSGETVKPFVTNAQMLITATPTADDHVVRLGDFDGRIFGAISVADIDNPATELGAIASVNGAIIMTYKVTANENEWTMYVFDSAVGTGANVPYTVAGSSGFWVAVAGKYSIFAYGAGSLTASRLVATDASKVLVSVANLASWVAGTSREITITDDSDGTVTVSIPLGLLLKAGTTALAPLTFQSGTLTTSPVAGAMEFVNDILYFTITTGAVRKKVAYSDTDYGGMYTYDKAVSLNIVAANIYHGYYAVAAGDILTGLVSGCTFDAGRNVDANITSEAVTGGLLRIICSAAHNLTAGDIVSITGANNALHNSSTRVSFDATNPTTEFICDDISYVAGAGASAAIVDEPAYLQITDAISEIFHLHWSISGSSAVANKQYKFEPVINVTHLDNAAAQATFGNTTANSISGHGLISVNTGDRIWMQCKNVTDGTNFVVKHFNMVLSRQ